MDMVDNVVVPTAERNAGWALEPKHMSLVTWSWFFLLIWIMRRTLAQQLFVQKEIQLNRPRRAFRQFHRDTLSETIRGFLPKSPAYRSLSAPPFRFFAPGVQKVLESRPA